MSYHGAPLGLAGMLKPRRRLGRARCFTPRGAVEQRTSAVFAKVGAVRVFASNSSLRLRLFFSPLTRPDAAASSVHNPANATTTSGDPM
jgi:hypothetical protein